VTEIVIGRRFRGPTPTANGGYTCGLVAAHVDASAVEVTLRAPPPLERPLAVERTVSGVRLLDGDTVVAEAEPTDVQLALPRGVTAGEAEQAEAGYSGAAEHPFPQCFVCGPEREPGDGLRLEPGPVDGDSLVATRWTPDPSLAGDDGLVRPEFVWAALDCPGAFAVELIGRGTRVLGRLAARVDALPRAGEPAIVVGWPLGGEGRRQEAGTALLAGDGAVLAVARAVWIEPRPRFASS
jgi:hypothetical protein